MNKGNRKATRLPSDMTFIRLFAIIFFAFVLAAMSFGKTVMSEDVCKSGYDNQPFLLKVDYSLCKVEEEQPFYYIPNTFTPNGDEFNNTFLPVFKEGYVPDNYILEVYTRTGQLIFESRDVRFGWDGTSKEGGHVPVGTYRWKLTFKDTKSATQHNKVGQVNVFR